MDENQNENVNLNDAQIDEAADDIAAAASATEQTPSEPSNLDKPDNDSPDEISENPDIPSEESPQEKPKKSHKKPIIISIICVCVVIIILGITLGIPLYKYNKAESLFNNGSYQEAASIYEGLNNFKDSDNKLSLCKWNIFLNYLEKNQDKLNKNKSPYSIAVREDKSGFDVSYHNNNKSGNSTTAKLFVFSFIYSDEYETIIALVNGTFANMSFLYPHYEQAESVWFVENYKLGDNLSDWAIDSSDIFNISPNSYIIEISRYRQELLMLSTRASSSSSNISSLNSCTPSILKSITKRLQNIVNDSNLDMTMADLGFKSLE